MKCGMSPAEPDVPKYNELMFPTVEALRALGGSGSNTEIDDKVIEQQGFSEEVQSVLLNNGPRTKLADRLHWARSYLKAIGLAENVRRGVWALTPAGREVAEDEIEPRRRAFLKEYHQERRTRAVESETPAIIDADEEAVERWQDQLLESLLAMDPAAFERLCQRLLREAGFSRTEVTGQSGDGGIDGVGVYRVSLVSFPVFFQAKRWRGSVRPSDVRDFRGAMAGRGEKGLLITTGTFTKEAKAEATRDGAPPVDLIDGAALCELLVQHRIGVRVRERIEYDVEVDQAALDAI